METEFGENHLKDFKESGMRRALGFAQSLVNEDKYKRISYSVEDWDNMIAIRIKTSINTLGIIFYDDGSFRNFMLEDNRK